MPPSFERVHAKLDGIEAELRRLGWWREEPPPPESYAFKKAFAADTMPFVGWLQFVFVPRVRSILAAKGGFPDQSNVGTRAIRELDGVIEADALITALCEFDQLFG